MAVLMLAGGDEFKPGNEPQDKYLIAHRGKGPAYVLVTANSKHPQMAADFACRWFGQLGLEMTELPVRTREDASSQTLVKQAAGGGLFYLAGGNPGRVVDVLKGTPVWDAIVQAWKGGAALAGSSAGAMAFGEWTLLESGSRAVPALNLVPNTAVIPHFETFGRGWVPAARQAVGAKARLLGIDERTAYILENGKGQSMGQGDVHLEI